MEMRCNYICTTAGVDPALKCDSVPNNYVNMTGGSGSMTPQCKLMTKPYPYDCFALIIAHA